MKFQIADWNFFTYIDVKRSWLREELLPSYDGRKTPPNSLLVRQYYLRYVTPWLKYKLCPHSKDHGDSEIDNLVKEEYLSRQKDRMWCQERWKLRSDENMNCKIFHVIYMYTEKAMCQINIIGPHSWLGQIQLKGSNPFLVRSVLVQSI